MPAKKSELHLWHKQGLWSCLACWSNTLTRSCWCHWETSWRVQKLLLDRWQRVILPGVNSDWSKLFAGVPQGSILRPLLFLIFINDIVNEIGSCIRLFADDTSLFIIEDDPVASAERLNADLIKILQWTETWLVTIYSNKTESLIISRKINKPIHPPLYMNNQVLEVDCQKHFGLFLSKDGSWHH